MKFLFDLGGIFFDWDPYHFYRNVFTDPYELDFFITHVCNNKWNLKQDAGRSIKEAENELIIKFPKYKDQISLYYSNHRNMIKGIFSNSIEALEELKLNNYSCYVLSNWSKETFIGMPEDYPFLKKFDGLLISGDVGLIKPDSAIYKLAIKKFSLVPKHTVFIDDRLENIKAAKKLGFNVIHLINPKEIKNKIKDFLS